MRSAATVFANATFVPISNALPANSAAPMTTSATILAKVSNVQAANSAKTERVSKTHARAFNVPKDRLAAVEAAKFLRLAPQVVALRAKNVNSANALMIPALRLLVPKDKPVSTETATVPISPNPTETPTPAMVETTRTPMIPTIQTPMIPTNRTLMIPTIRIPMTPIIPTMRMIRTTLDVPQQAASVQATTTPRFRSRSCCSSCCGLCWCAVVNKRNVSIALGACHPNASKMC
jgi:hypothetical protein